MIRHEIWMQLPASNLIRTLLAEAAQVAGVEPRELGFKAALQTLNAFAAVWSLAASSHDQLYAAVLKALARGQSSRPHRALRRQTQTSQTDLP